MVHGVTNSDATYRVLGAYRPDDERDESPKARGSLRVDRGEIAYGGDVVEIAVPKAALPRLGPAADVRVYQSVKVGDRMAGELRGRWVISPGAAVGQGSAGGKSAAASSPVARQPVTPEEKAGAAAVFARFMQALERNDRPAAEKLAAELKSTGPATVALMEERVKAGSKNERGMALLTLRDFREMSAPALPAILAASHDPDEDIRGLAAWTIGAVDRSEASLRRLVEMLKDASASVRWRAADSLAEFGPAGAAAVPALAETALDPVEEVSRSAVSALGRIRSRPEVAVPTLVKALRVQTLAAVNALAAYGAEARPAVPALVELARKRAAEGAEDDWLGHDVAVALATIGGPETKQALPSLEALHSRMTSVNFKQDLADAIYKVKALK
jgi:HEAT repeat protein